MENSSSAQELWEEQQRADRAQTDFEDREWLKGFALLIALIVLTLTFATILARSGADGTIRL